MYVCGRFIRFLFLFLSCLICLSTGLPLAPASRAEAARPAKATDPVEPDAPQTLFAFSPSGGADKLVLQCVNSAQSSIHMAAFSFTSKDIANALRKARQRGVSVHIVADAEANTDRYTAVTFLANQKIPIRLNSEFQSMHNKFMIIDMRHVQTGSFNYTYAAATKNAENVLVLRNRPDIAEAYYKEWQRLWQKGKDFPPKY